MHITTLPPHSEAEFLKALTQGANGAFSRLNAAIAIYQYGIYGCFTERILDERKSMFPYTDQQAQRFMQVYRDLKCT